MHCNLCALLERFLDWRMEIGIAGRAKGDMKTKTDISDILSWVMHISILVNLLGSGICWAFGIVGWEWPACSFALFMAIWVPTIILGLSMGALASSIVSTHVHKK